MGTGKYFIFTQEHMFTNIMLHSLRRGGEGDGRKRMRGYPVDGSVNLPIQMMPLTDRDGRMTLQWF